MPYWPDSKESKEVGPYVLTMNLEREASDYKVRVLKMYPAQQVTLGSRSAFSDVHLQDFQLLSFSLSQPQNSRIIWQYQYISWPDHGVPEEPGGVLSFLTQVNTKQAEFAGAGPMIIHCR